MKDFWNILGLEPTKDVSAIKRAYAQRARACHPEEDQEGFLRLREAYQAALAWAEGPPAPSAAGRPQGNSREDNRGGLREDSGAPARSAGGNGGWFLPDEAPENLPNPYQNHEAVRRFMELYTGKQRRDLKLWMDYFTSADFLDAGWDSRFTALLLEKITEVERTLPPGKEFLLWLCTAYQFSVKEDLAVNKEQRRIEKRERQMKLCPGAKFDGMNSILRIAAKGPLPKRPGGDELALLESFKDYRHLVRLAESGAWNQQALEEFQEILRHYIPFYIKDRCDPKADPDYQRHPAGLRLLLHFFRREDLPEELYRNVWQRLDLKSALMGRAKILYGPLRELVTERVPGIAGEVPENFLQLNRDHDAYRARIKEHPEREDEESAAFFQRENLQKALRSRRFVAEQLLTYTNWRREGMGEGLIRRMLDFYRAHPEIPGAAQAVAGLEGDLLTKAAQRRNQEDAQAEGLPYYVPLTLRNRPLFRHWLNTGFYSAQDPRTGTPLLAYLNKLLPYQEAWSRRFVSREDGSPPPRTAAAAMGRIEIDFYLRHMEFRVSGKPAYRPCLFWEETAAEGGDWFFFMLPLTAAPESQFDGVSQEIYRRLASTAAPKKDQALIAQCLAGYVCRLPADEYTGQPLPPERALPMELFMEDGDQLYGCSWYEGERTLTLFKQTSTGRRVQKQREMEPGQENAVETARRMLAEALSPMRFNLYRQELPWNVYFTGGDGLEQTLTRPDLIDQEHLKAEAAELLDLEELPETLAEWVAARVRPVPEPDEEEEPEAEELSITKEDLRSLLERSGNEMPEGVREWAVEQLKPVPELQAEEKPAEEKKPLTEEDLQFQLARYGKGELRRLELRWCAGKLVLLKEAAGCACLYFEDTWQHDDIWYALLSKPEVYRTVESDEVVHVPFGMGKLADYCVHESPSSVLRELDRVFMQLAAGRPQAQGAGGWLWTSNVSQRNGRHKLLMAQQKLAGFPPNRSRDGLNASFVFSRYPAWMETEALEGERNLSEIKSGSYGMASTGLFQFMREQLARLRLTWNFKTPEGGTYQRHLVLLRDGGRFLLAWLQDDRERADFYMAETPSESAEESILGSPVPARLIHRDMKSIRNGVDLLLDDIDFTEPVAKRLFIPAASRPYPELRALLVRD